MDEYVAEFRVNAETERGEIVKLVGNVKSLGCWQIDKAVELANGPEKNQWSVRVNLPVNCTIKYRYICCRSCNFDDERQCTVVTRWETHLEPRIFSDTKLTDVHKSVDIFGEYNNVHKIDQGWLTYQSEVRLYLTGKDGVSFRKAAHTSDTLNVVVKPIDCGSPTKKRCFDLRNGSAEIEDTSGKDGLSPHGDCLLSVLSSENSKYQRQPNHGVQLKSNDLFLYKVQTLSPETLVQQSIKKAVSLNYIVIKPCPISPQMSLERSYAKYWTKRNPLNVGHRGMGKSYKQTALVKENTIGSLNSAASFGADYVEFDVHLSKDLVPVLFHDFRLCYAVQKVAKDELLPDYILHERCVGELTLNDMKHLKLFHETSLQASEVKTALNDDEVCRAFPTLREVFESVDPNVGFNIEVKYPMQLQDGSWESEIRLERNLYVDKIIEDVFMHCTESRRVVFSSFDPNICTMLRLKQNKYPVMFLTQGETTRYAAYVDEVTHSSAIAVAFALASDLLGVCFHSEPLMKDPSAFYVAKQNNLVCFVWGDDLNNVQNIDYFKKLAFDGIIYDRINELHDGTKNVFLMEKEQIISTHQA